MVSNTELLPGFEDYSTEANAAFRTCLKALSRPGMILPFDVNAPAPAPLLPTSAAVLLSLADYETSVWLDNSLASSDAVNEYLKFHTAVPLTDCPANADFAAISDPMHMPALNELKTGTLEYPDRSTLVIAQVDELISSGWMLEGPGIDGSINFSASPLPQPFTEQLQQNRQMFPCGVDFVFVTHTHIAALPRSTFVQGEG